ncbi:MAG: molybdate ABC transporter substrate-binding protein [Actinobacteria bacterium]|nr:molybdate ABC transporter substrate-binding protein [Actinomycetota bacterium]
MRAAIAALACLGLGCPAVASADDLTVFAASSLKNVFPRIAPARYSFAGSDQLAFQLREGAPADVFAAASPRYPQELNRRGLVARPVTFATNRLILVLPRRNPAGIKSVRDLRRPGVKLVIGQPGVPIGDYTRKILKNLGLSSVLSNVVSQEPDARSIVGKVVLGQADAGFVYATDARPVAKHVQVIELPARAQPVVRYEIAVVSSSKRLEGARAFVRRILGPAGRARLAAAGFGLP